MDLFTITLISLFSVFTGSIKDSVDKPVHIAEKVYLHIDRKFYNPGDEIWFKAYVTDASNNKPSLQTNSLHVELISPESKIIVSKTLRITTGTGNGDFHIDELIPSGRYRIRAYTNFMRNFENPFFFTKEIVIINPTDVNKKLNDSIAITDNKLDMFFFPEGGSLIEDIGSVVAFKAADPSGKGCDVTGKIYSTKGELITTFNSSHLGMGQFYFKPARGFDYYSVITDNNGREYRAELPKIFSNGFGIHTVVLQNKSLLIKVYSNDETLLSSINKEIAVSISSRNLTTSTFRFRPNSVLHSFIVPLDEFPDGILKVTISEPDGLPLAERLIFIQKNNQHLLDVITDKPVYRPREPVNINISLSDDSLEQNITSLSLSATEAGSSEKSSDPSSSIVSWFLLESDIIGEVENPYSYFETSNPERFQQMDLLLLTQGWRDFKWKYDSTGYFNPEKGFSISGRVKRMVSKKPLAGARVNIGLLSDNLFSFVALKPDSKGKFNMKEIDLTGSARAIVCVTDKENTFGGWLIIDSSNYKPAPVEILPPQDKYLVTNSYSELKNEAILKLIQKKMYKLDDTISVGEVVVTSAKRESIDNIRLKGSRSYYIMPDNELIITPDLENRPTLGSVISGRLRGVEVSDLGEITVRGQVPLILLDGIPGRDISNIPPYMVDRVDVLYWSSLFGHQGANGIINVITKRGENIQGESPVAYKAKINLKGYDFPKVFYSPRHSTNDPAYMTDLRSTIYWEPNILLKNKKTASFSCFNSDKPSLIEVKAEGITSDGIPVTARMRYEVRK